MAPKRKAPASRKKKTKENKTGAALKASASPVDQDKKKTTKKTKIQADEEIAPPLAIAIETESDQEVAASKKEEKKGQKKVQHDKDKDNDNDDGDQTLPLEDLKLPPPSNVIVVEASKECNSFKTRAAKVEEELKKAVPGVIIKVNPEKPRKGCFEVRGEDGTLYISCLNMPRPFSKMKNLDLDKEIEAIVSKMK